MKNKPSRRPSSPHHDDETAIESKWPIPIQEQEVGPMYLGGVSDNHLVQSERDNKQFSSVKR
jgi:hypothetical protein